MPDKPSSSVRQFIQGAPIVQVAELEQTAAYFRDVLGFNFDYGDGQYAVVWRGNTALHFVRSPESVRGVQLFFWVADVQALYMSDVRNTAGRVQKSPRSRMCSSRASATSTSAIPMDGC